MTQPVVVIFLIKNVLLFFQAAELNAPVKGLSHRKCFEKRNFLNSCPPETEDFL